MYLKIKIIKKGISLKLLLIGEENEENVKPNYKLTEKRPAPFFPIHVWNLSTFVPEDQFI
jgi:hypothetical protein